MKYKAIDVFLIPKEHRGQGRGTELMHKLCGWADVENVCLVLSADSTVCGRQGSQAEDSRLIDFYASFGFKPSTIEHMFTDTIWSDTNIMERKPEPVLSEYILKLADLKVTT